MPPYAHIIGWGKYLPVNILTNEELAKTVKSPDIQKRLAEDGGIAVGSTPAEFQKLLAEEVPRWRKVVNETGIKAD